MNKERETIYIVRKKKGHGHGHHGGAWKVAFADFMTAMFAMFLVLWLVNQSSDVKAAVAGYFKDPLGRAGEAGSSIVPGQGAQVAKPKPSTPAVMTAKRDEEQERLTAVESALKDSLSTLPDFKEIAEHMVIEMTKEGLRIQLVEDSTGVFFETGSASPKPRVVEFLKLVGHQLSSLPNGVVVDGYTDAVPYSRPGGYSNWELSADRANTARRMMVEGGLAEGQIEQVRGHAERSLRDTLNPSSASNRRVTITMLLDAPAP